MNELKHTVSRIKPKEPPVNKRISACNLLLYEDTSDYNINEVLNSIKCCSSCYSFISSYAFIKHDNDYYLDETFDAHGRKIASVGEKKKNHYHVVLSFTSPQVISDISLKLGIPQRFIEKCKNLEKSLLYLTHRNAEDKTPYGLDKVETNIRPYVEYLYNSYVPVLSPMVLLWSYLEQTPYPSVQGFIKYIPDERIDDIKKYYSIIRDIINEYKVINPDIEDRYKEKRNEYLNYMNALNKVCQTFGNVSVDTGKEIIQYTLNDDGNIDLLGFTIRGK